VYIFFKLRREDSLFQGTGAKGMGRVCRPVLGHGRTQFTVHRHRGSGGLRHKSEGRTEEIVATPWGDTSTQRKKRDEQGISGVLRGGGGHD